MQNIIITALITTVLCVGGISTYGQTFSEWWQQKMTRIRYLRQQVYVLEALKGIMKKGYQEAEEGVDSIRTIAREELTMHEQFLKSLKYVKPAFKNCPELMSSRALAGALIKQITQAVENYTQSSDSTNDNLQWIKTYAIQLGTDLVDDLVELNALTLNDNLVMKDAERYRRIRSVAAHIRAVYEVGMSFLLHIEEVLIVRQERANERYLRGLQSK